MKIRPPLHISLKGDLATKLLREKYMRGEILEHKYLVTLKLKYENVKLNVNKQICVLRFFHHQLYMSL